MFTGIIEDIGVVSSFKKTGDCGKITIATGLDLDAINIGDSIAVSGVCLTVVTKGDGKFSSDVAGETLKVTTLGSLVVGSRVNLEGALSMGKALGGHLVTGHVDSPAVIKDIKKVTSTDGDYIEIEVKVDKQFLPHLVRKGSVALDGISLTVADILPDGFRVAIIPHTLEKTTLGEKKKGDALNIETDLIGKYVERFMSLRGGGGDSGSESKSITDSLLRDEGFLK